jgi:hypothetical protein
MARISVLIIVTIFAIVLGVVPTAVAADNPHVDDATMT